MKRKNILITLVLLLVFPLCSLAESERKSKFLCWKENKKVTLTVTRKTSSCHLTITASNGEELEGEPSADSVICAIQLAEKMVHYMEQQGYSCRFFGLEVSE